mgnify:CR=1 FL=1
MSTKNSSRFTPVIIAVSVVVGILIGTFYAKHFAGNRLGIINGSSNKLNALLRIVDDQYVDTVNMADLVEKAMPQILAELDPHSTYIPAQNLEEVNSDLEGSFSGIGIQFTIQNDTFHVIAVVQGGPSEKIGLMAGDRSDRLTGNIANQTNRRKGLITLQHHTWRHSSKYRRCCLHGKRRYRLCESQQIRTYQPCGIA